jgi:hypothetical protein
MRCWSSPRVHSGRGIRSTENGRPGGLKRLVDDVLATLHKEEVIAGAKVARLVISAHSGGYRPVAYCIDRGGMNAEITHLFLFDAFYAKSRLVFNLCCHECWYFHR